MSINVILLYGNNVNEEKFIK